MALEATHIRFALDLKNKYQVQDIRKYLAGSIYPDSRNITKINRGLTHNEDILRSEFAKDDFRKGWQTHRIMDIVQNYVFKKYIPTLGQYNNKDDKQNEWIEFSAARIIADIYDMEKFDIQKAAGYLDYCENPNGEDINLIKEYNKLIADLYRGKKKVTIKDHFEMWLKYGRNEELGKKVKEKAGSFLGDKELVEKIKSCYKIIFNTYDDCLLDCRGSFTILLNKSN